MAPTLIIKTPEDAEFVLSILKDPRKAKIIETSGWNLQELKDAAKSALISPYQCPPVPQEILDAARTVDSWFKSNGITRWELMNLCSRNHAEDLKFEEDLRNKYPRGQGDG